MASGSSSSCGSEACLSILTFEWRQDGVTNSVSKGPCASGSLEVRVLDPANHEIYNKTLKIFSDSHGTHPSPTFTLPPDVCQHLRPGNHLHLTLEVEETKEIKRHPYQSCVVMPPCLPAPGQGMAADGWLHLSIFGTPPLLMPIYSEITMFEETNGWTRRRSACSLGVLEHSRYPHEKWAPLSSRVKLVEQGPCPLNRHFKTHHIEPILKEEEKSSGKEMAAAAASEPSSSPGSQTPDKTDFEKFQIELNKKYPDSTFFKKFEMVLNKTYPSLTIFKKFQMLLNKEYPGLPIAVQIERLNTEHPRSLTDFLASQVDSKDIDALEWLMEHCLPCSQLKALFEGERLLLENLSLLVKAAKDPLQASSLLDRLPGTVKTLAPQEGRLEILESLNTLLQKIVSPPSSLDPKQKEIVASVLEQLCPLNKDRVGQGFQLSCLTEREKKPLLVLDAYNPAPPYIPQALSEIIACKSQTLLMTLYLALAHAGNLSVLELLQSERAKMGQSTDISQCQFSWEERDELSKIFPSLGELSMENRSLLEAMGYFASSTGHLDLLKFIATDHLDRLKQRVAMGAVKGNQIAILDWLKERVTIDEPLVNTMCGQAARYGNIDVLDWLVNHIESFKLEENVSRLVSSTAMSGHLRILEWLFQKGFGKDRLFGKINPFVSIVASHGHLSLLQFVHRINPLTEGVVPTIISRLRLGKKDQILNILDWLITINIPFEKIKEELEKRKEFAEPNNLFSQWISSRKAP